MLEIQKTLPKCHCIGKILKYPRISWKITKMPLAARVAHARLLLVAAKFSGQPMVDSGRSEIEDSDGCGLDDRWWLKRENRWFEASVADEDRGRCPSDEAAKTLKTTGVLLYIRAATFLWWFEGLIQPEMGDRMRRALIWCDAVHRKIGTLGVTWHNEIKGKIISKAEMGLGFNLVW